MVPTRNLGSFYIYFIHSVSGKGSYMRERTSFLRSQLFLSADLTQSRICITYAIKSRDFHVSSLNFINPPPCLLRKGLSPSSCLMMMEANWDFRVELIIHQTFVKYLVLLLCYGNGFICSAPLIPHLTSPLTH